MSTWPVPWWTFTAGLGGVVVVVAGVVTVERLGVAIFSIAFFAGQMSFGLVVDRLGIGPGGQRPVTATRVGAAALAVGRRRPVTGRATRPASPRRPRSRSSVAAGAASAVQSAFNGRIAATLGDPLAPTVVNVTLGTSCLGLFVAVAAVTGSIGPLDWPSEPWLYAGGVLGVTIVLSLAAATAAVGVLRTTVAMLAAQLIAAFAVDWLVRDDPPTAGVIAGALLIVVAVLVVNRRPSLPRGSRPPRRRRRRPTPRRPPRTVAAGIADAVPISHAPEGFYCNFCRIGRLEAFAGWRASTRPTSRWCCTTTTSPCSWPATGGRATRAPSS